MNRNEMKLSEEISEEKKARSESLQNQSVYAIFIIPFLFMKKKVRNVNLHSSKRPLVAQFTRAIYNFNDDIEIEALNHVKVNCQRKKPLNRNI